MLKSEFEKRHGKIQPNFSHYWNTAIAKKYGVLKTFDSNADQPAHIWHIIQNSMPKPTPETVQNVFQYLTSEQRKEVRDLFLQNLDGFYFADYWGYFSRKDPKDYDEEEKKEFVKILKIIKNGFKKYKYSSGTTRTHYIDRLITRYGGYKNSTAKQDFARGIEKIKTAKKLPRKLKKEAKKPSFWARFGVRSK